MPEIFKRLKIVSCIFAKDTVIFRENHKGDTMYIIQSGRIKISKKGPEAEKTLAILGKGEFFGEMALLEDKPRSATATVIENAELLCIPKEALETMLAQKPQFAIRMLRKLCERLREADEQLKNLMIPDIDERVVDALLRLARKHGKPEDEGVTFKLPLAEGSLAGIVGLPPKQVKKALRDLVEAGFINVKGDKVMLVNNQDLEDYLEYIRLKNKLSPILERKEKK